MNLGHLFLEKKIKNFAAVIHPLLTLICSFSSFLVGIKNDKRGV